jgi:hypothetical protein
LTSIAQPSGAQQSEIASGKSIGFSKGTHGYVLSRPFADARQLAEAQQELFDIRDSGENNFAIANSLSKRTQAMGTCSRQTYQAEVGVSQLRG